MISPRPYAGIHEHFLCIFLIFLSFCRHQFFFSSHFVFLSATAIRAPPPSMRLFVHTYIKCLFDYIKLSCHSLLCSQMERLLAIVCNNNNIYKRTSCNRAWLYALAVCVLTLLESTLNCRMDKCKPHTNFRLMPKQNWWVVCALRTQHCLVPATAHRIGNFGSLGWRRNCCLCTHTHTHTCSVHIRA